MRARIVEALEQLEQRRLAGARGADHRHRLAGADVEREIGERGAVRAGGIAEGDPVEGERALGRLGKRRGAGGGRDVGLLVEQLGKAAGRARGAQQVAIDFGERAERAGDEARGEHERHDRSAREPAGGDIGHRGPYDQRDRREQRADHQRRHDRAQAEAALARLEGAGDGTLEALGLALLLPEGLDDAHRAQRLGSDRADIGHPVLAGARELPHPAAQPDDRQDGDRDADDEIGGDLGREREEIDDAARAGEQVPERDRDGGADHLLDDRGVRGEARGDLGRAVLLEPFGREAEQVAMHRHAQVRDGALGQPGDEIEADRGERRERHHDEQQPLEIDADPAGVRPGGEAMVDDLLEGAGDQQRRQRRADQRDDRDQQLERVAPREAPHDQEIGDLAPLRPIGGGERGRRRDGFGHARRTSAIGERGEPSFAGTGRPDIHRNSGTASSSCIQRGLAGCRPGFRGCGMGAGHRSVALRPRPALRRSTARL